MRNFLPLLAGATAAAALAAPTLAQESAPNYDKGPVWDFQEVRTKDGKFDDYMKWVTTGWKAQEEAMKRMGYIVDYKVYTVVDPRNGEPDVLLGTAYSSAAAMMDHPVAEEFAMGQKIYGSVSKANQEQADRASLRTPMDEVIVREIRLK